MRSILIAAIGMAAAAPVHGQVRASERGSVSQVVDGTTITIDFARPRVRGRVIYGRLVHWGEVWTPGANMATTLETDRDIAIDGHAVPKGKYSIWMVVDSATRWTIVLDPDWSRFHTARPRPRDNQIRWEIVPEAAEPTEVLTWSFPDISATGGTLRMAWGDRAASLKFTVTPSGRPRNPFEEVE